MKEQRKEGTKEGTKEGRNESRNEIKERNQGTKSRKYVSMETKQRGRRDEGKDHILKLNSLDTYQVSILRVISLLVSLRLSFYPSATSWI